MSGRLLALVVGIAGALHAREVVYTVAAPGHAAPARVVTRLAGDLGGWDVETGFDPVRCEIYCVYRQKAGGPAGVLPPVALIEIFTGAESSTVTLNPAGLGMPGACRQESPAADFSCVPGKTWYAPPASRPKVAGRQPRPEPRLIDSYRRITSVSLRI